MRIAGQKLILRGSDRKVVSGARLLWHIIIYRSHAAFIEINIVGLDLFAEGHR